MSVTEHQHTHPPLTANERTRPGNDPTGTEWIQYEYGSRLRGTLRKLNAAIRDGFVSDDVLQIQNAPREPEPQQPYDFPTDAGKVRAFMDWFRRQLQRGFLSVVSMSDNMFIQASYKDGIQDARERLTVETPEPDFSLPVHRRALRTLYTRSYELLQDVSQDMATGVRDELVEGLRDGDHSSDIARSITNRVDKIGKHRATLISRTEVINSYTDATLNQYESVGVEGVTVKSELLTAHDERVCEICEAIEEMGVFILKQIRNKTVEIAGKLYRIKPPIHPQCRCTLLPVMGL